VVAAPPSTASSAMEDNPDARRFQMGSELWQDMDDAWNDDDDDEGTLLFEPDVDPSRPNMSRRRSTPALQLDLTGSLGMEDHVPHAAKRAIYGAHALARWAWRTWEFAVGGGGSVEDTGVSSGQWGEGCVGRVPQLQLQFTFPVRAMLDEERNGKETIPLIPVGMPIRWNELSTFQHKMQSATLQPSQAAVWKVAETQTTRHKAQ